jgi:hypothetical protein
MAFCGNCGTKANSNKFCIKCGSQIVIEPEDNGNGSNFGQLLDLIEDSYPLLYIKRLVNIESGEISVRAPRRTKTGKSYLMKSGELAHPLTDCDECQGQATQGHLYFINCESCLRSPENYFWIKSGQGDGVYTVLEIFDCTKSVKGDGEIETIGLMVVMVPTAEFTQPIVDQAMKNGEQFLGNKFDRLRIFDSLEGFAITSMNIGARGELYITDSSTGFGSGNSSYSRYFVEEETYNFYAFAEISPADRNASFQEERAAVMKRMTEKSGASSKPSEISMIPRVIVGLKQDWVQAKGFKVGLSRPDDEGIFWDWLIGHQDSHIELETGTAAWFNSKLSFEDVEEELSFLLLGATHGDQDCLKALKSPRFASILEDFETVAVLLVQRDQVLLGNEIYESGDVKGWLKKLNS